MTKVFLIYLILFGLSYSTVFAQEKTVFERMFYLDVGSDGGKLFYDMDDMGRETFPLKMTVDKDEKFTFFENFSYFELDEKGKKLEKPPIDVMRSQQFSKEGKDISTKEIESLDLPKDGFVEDSQGNLYTGESLIKITDKIGKEKGKITVSNLPPKATLAAINKDKGILLFWLFGPEKKNKVGKGENLSYQNRLLLYQIDKSYSKADYSAELWLPDDIIHFPDKNRDNSTAKQRNTKLAAVNENSLFLMFYEPENYWVLKVNLDEYINRYGNLEKRKKEELRLLRNEIFARYGKKFQSPDLKKYFSSKPWYSVDPKFKEDNLFPEEKKLVELLYSFEQKAKK